MSSNHVINVVHKCLCTVSQLGGIRGDGYKGANGDQSASPHTIFEMFEGLNVDRAAKVGEWRVVQVILQFD